MALEESLLKAIEYHTAEFRINPAEVIGALEIVKTMFMDELREEDEEEDVCP